MGNKAETKETKRKPRRKPAARPKPNTVSAIIKDLYEYATKHPEVIEDTKRIFNTKYGATTVKHIPIQKVIKILDEVVVHRHGGTWSDNLKYMSFQVDNAVVCIDLVITDKYGAQVSRLGVGAADIYGRTRGSLSTDSIDNATKMAMASAIKKASSQFELGLSMWEKDKEKDEEPTVIDEKKGAITGGAQVHTDNKSSSSPPPPATTRLPDELAAKITEKQKEHNITQADVINILKDKIPESDGKPAWLLDGDQNKRVDRLLKAIDTDMKGTQDADKKKEEKKG